MKKITILLILFSVNCFSQIKIEKPNNETEIYKPLDKPLVPKFNEKIDLNEYRTAEEFLGLIGNELFYYPDDYITDNELKSISYLPKNKFKFDKVRYKENQLVNLSGRNKQLFEFLKIEENYFIVDSIKFHEESYVRKRINEIEFNKLQKTYLPNYRLSGSADIYTHHKSSNEIIIFTISNNLSAKKFISVPYFNYLTSKYLDKKILLKKPGFEHYEENAEIESFNRKYLDSARIFQITKVTIKKTILISGYGPFLSLKKLDNTTKEKEFYWIKDDIIFWDDFIAGADLREKNDSIRAKLKEQEKDLQKIDNEKKRIERYNILVKKYGKYYGEIIDENKVIIGMTKKMCQDSWGEPNSINRTANSYGTSEQWVYSGGNYLYFDDGKLTSIQN